MASNQTSDILLDRPKVLSQFKYGTDNTVTKLQPTPDNCCWFSYHTTNRVTLVDNKGTIKKEKEHHCKVQDISLSPETGNLWFCCWDEKTINEVLPTQELPFTRFTIERGPRCLCLTREDNVVVGIWNSVTVYTREGTVRHTTTDKESGIEIPLDISQCPITGNIAVVSYDREGEKSHIIVYCNALNRKHQYREIPGVTPDMFDPVRICYDSRGHLVMTDAKRKTIDLISGTGQYIMSLYTNEILQGNIGLQTNDVMWAELKSDTGGCEIKLLKYYSD